jgi:hypothetical protein
VKVSEIFEKFDPHAIHNLADPKDKEVTKVDKVEDLAAILKAQCTDILEAYKKGKEVIYRGIKGAKDQVVITAIRTDRKPVEMAGVWHNELHSAFIKYGLKATRKNAIFCTTSLNIAEDWGNPYIIFPKDGWTVTVFKEYKKDYTFYTLERMRAHRELTKMKTPADRIAYIGSKLEEMGAMNITTADQLAQILKEKYEDILLTGSSYIAVRSDSPLIRKLGPLLGINL